ncbi:MAG TPA: hypothetical protein PLP30_11595 [Clostridia bacterium]|nr:hypothetical protein [Clostridia bacterium]
MKKHQLFKALCKGEIHVSNEGQLYINEVISKEDYDRLPEEVKNDYCRSSNDGSYSKRIIVGDDSGNISSDELVLVTMINTQKIHDIRESIASIEKMVRFFYVIGVFCLVAGLLGLFIYLLAK